MQLNGSLASGPLYPSQVTALGLSLSGPPITSAEMQEVAASNSLRPVPLPHPEMALSMSSPRLLLNHTDGQQHAAYGNAAPISHSPHLPNSTDVLNHQMVST